MSRLNKQDVLRLLRKSCSIQTPTLNRYFKSVWVGEVMKQQLEKAKQKLSS